MHATNHVLRDHVQRQDVFEWSPQLFDLNRSKFNFMDNT